MSVSETEEELPPTHDEAIGALIKSLINGEVAASKDAFGDTPRDRLRNHMKNRANDTVMGSIVGLSAYLQARAAERQATAMEKVARTVSTTATASREDVTAQAIVDEREPRRDYLATTYSLPFKTLALLWAMRGMVMDAAIKSLSRPERFDPYLRVSTEDIAWSLRLAPEGLWSALPRNPRGEIDYRLLEEWDIVHYGGTSEQPDDWMYGG